MDLATHADNPTHVGRHWTPGRCRLKAECSARSSAALQAPVQAEPVPVDLDASGSKSVAPDGITKYEWDFGDRTFTESADKVTHTFSRGRYTVRVRVSNSRGPIGIAEKQLIVSKAPSAVITPLSQDPKQGVNVVLDGSHSSDPESADPSKYEWDLDYDGTNSHPRYPRRGPDRSVPDRWRAGGRSPRHRRRRRYRDRSDAGQRPPGERAHSEGRGHAKPGGRGHGGALRCNRVDRQRRQRGRLRVGSRRQRQLRDLDGQFGDCGKELSESGRRQRRSAGDRQRRQVDDHTPCRPRAGHRRRLGARASAEARAPGRVRPRAATPRPQPPAARAPTRRPSSRRALPARPSKR